MLVRRYPRGFAFYLADPISSVHEFTPIAEWLSLAASNFVAIRVIRVQQIALQRKACCLLLQSARNDAGLTKGARHQAIIHLLCWMEHSGNAFAPALGHVRSGCRSGACHRHWLKHSDGGRDGSQSSGYVSSKRP